MAQFIGKATEYLPYGSVKLFAPPKAEDCGTNQRFCQPTEQGDNITFQFLAAETVDLVADGTFPDGSHNSICGIESWCGNGWGIVDNTIQHLITPMPNPLIQDSIFTINNYYKIEFTITGMTTNITGVGTLQIANGGNGQFVSSDIFTRDGTYIIYYIATSTGALWIVPSGLGEFDGAISNVSVVQVATATNYGVDIYNTETGILVDNVPAAAITGSTSNNVITVDFNWTHDVMVTNGCREIRVNLAGGSIGDPGNVMEDTFDTNQGWGTFGGVNVPGGFGPFMEFFFVGDIVNAAFIFALEVGAEYTVTYDVIIYGSGSVRLRVGGTQGIARTANGTYTETLICTTNGSLNFQFNAIAGAGSLGVDNLIVSKADNLDGISECFDLQTSHDCSLLWTWSNDNRWGNFDYSIITGGSITNFQHKLRLICKFRGTKYPSERNIGEDSAGVKAVDYFNMRKTKLLDIDFIPDYLCDAIAAFWAHDNRTINGTSYIMDDEFEPSVPNDSKVLFKDLMNATIEIQETTQPDLINRNE